MKREEKNALSRQRILDAAMREFSEKGYEGASLNTICAAYDISKGIIYHYFKDKDALYLLCIQRCFDTLTDYLREATATLSGSAEERLLGYFDARLRFFGENPLLLGIFADVVFSPPPGLAAEVAACRGGFDQLNISILTELLESSSLRPGLTVDYIVEEFRQYMDFFHIRFRSEYLAQPFSEEVLKKHEERCHRQLDVLLHGVLDENHAKF